MKLSATTSMVRYLKVSAPDIEQTCLDMSTWSLWKTVTGVLIIESLVSLINSRPVSIVECPASIESLSSRILVTRPISRLGSTILICSHTDTDPSQRRVHWWPQSGLWQDVNWRVFSWHLVDP